jgi:8-hydroxy-5-deazaflavin:NADPH oxidoreductase
MRIGVLGTGMVGNAIAAKLADLGHEVKIGSREAGEGKVTFAGAAAFGELVFNCTSGVHSLAALEAAGAENLAGKVLIDVANALDFSAGRPPTLAVANTDSLGEQIQRAFPEAKVVKSLNTMNCEVMVDPAKVPGAHNVFVCGDDAEAKLRVGDLLQSFGWPAESIVDLGGIEAARGPEMYLPLWLRLWGAVGTGHFNIAVVRA